MPSLAGCESALLLVNAIDPQLNTIVYFMEALEDIPHYVVLNKVDAVSVTRAQEIIDSIGGMSNLTTMGYLEASVVKGRGLGGVRKAISSLPQGDVAVLGIFNAGKTSLINSLTGEHNKVDDIPGTTLEVTSHKYEAWNLLDTIGDVWDTNVPLMFSIDLRGCDNPTAKVRKVLQDEVDGLQNTIEGAVPSIVEAVKEIIPRIEDGGKIVVCGAGASALVAMEIAGQGQETGIPIIPITNNLAQAQPISFAKGIAEDEGSLARYAHMLITDKDIAIGISASGGTGFVHEFLRLSQGKALTIAITENSDTPLGKYADIIIKSEAKPEGPSSSRIQLAHLAIGHALMITLADERNLNAEDCIRYMLPDPVRNKKMGIK